MSDFKITKREFAKGIVVSGEEMREHRHQQWKRLDVMFRIDSRGYYLVSTCNARYAHISGMHGRRVSLYPSGYTQVLCKAAKMRPYFLCDGTSADLDGKDICQRCLETWNPGWLHV